MKRRLGFKMDDMHHKLQNEYQQALVRLLRELAPTKDDSRPYVVLTTAPSIWLPQCGGDTVKLLDVSGITGASLWRSEVDIMDEALDKNSLENWRST